MKHLTEVQMRILSELEEASEETPTAMLNTVITPTGRDVELEDYREALTKLIQLGLLGLSFGRDRSGRLTDSSRDQALSTLDTLLSNFRFDSRRMIWIDNRITGPPFKDLYPYIVDTAAGRQAAHKILAARGYRWWRRQE